MKGSRTGAMCALVCAASVALGAYASHAADAQDRQRLALAASFAFAHALAVLVMAARGSVLARVTRVALFTGVALFSGSLAAAALLGTTPVAAPMGGILLLGGWLLAAIDYYRVP